MTQASSCEQVTESSDQRLVKPQLADLDGVLARPAIDARDLALCSSEEARSLLSCQDALAHMTLPIAIHRKRDRLLLRVVLADDSPLILNKLRFLCGIEIVATAISEEILKEAIPIAYFGSDHRLRGFIERIAQTEVAVSRTCNVPQPRGDAARFITALLEYAAVRGASDLHLAPGAAGVMVKIRIDGTLLVLEECPYAAIFHEQVVARLKVLASLDISVKRLPQDGALVFSVGESQRSARISTLPTVYGESVVVRIARAESIPPLVRLGIEPIGLGLLRRALLRHEGLVLLTGPTGSGKTTTMYSSVLEIDRGGRNVVTVEDPVESKLSGIVQVQVCLEQGLDYSRAIRSVLRHDPEGLLIGEVRDKTSALMALEAASTGHLTLSSLHVGSCLDVIRRLELLGVSKAQSIHPLALILNQRLLPKLCAACRCFDAAAPSALQGVAYRPLGCDACSDSGYRGRVLVTEILDLQSRQTKDACYRAATSAELLELLPGGVFIPWTESLQHHLMKGDISLAQVEGFVEDEME